MTPTPRTVLPVVLAALLPALGALGPKPDADTWWHLAVGRLVWDAGTLPDTDPFSRLGREQPMTWVAYSWLYELGLYAGFSTGGLAGVMLLRTVLAAVSAAALLAVAARAGPVPVLVAGYGLIPFSAERPWHLTMVLTVLTLVAVGRVRDGGSVRRAWWLVPLFVVWANVHVQFVLGWLVLGLAVAFPGRADRRAVAALLAACGLATLANPYHARLFGVIFDYTTQLGTHRVVSELFPPDPRTSWPWAVGGLLAWAGARTARGRPVDGFAVALLVCGLVLSLRMRRDLWFGALAATYVLGRTNPVAVSPGAVAGVVLAVFATVRGANLLGIGAAVTPTQATAAAYPVAACEYMRETHPPGPLFNSFDWGGYLIWELPEYPVSVDGRTNLYGSERVIRAAHSWAADPGWDADPDLRSARIVIASVREPLTAALRKHPDWRVVNEDGTAVVLTRQPED